MSLRDVYANSMKQGLGLTQFTPYGAEYDSVLERAQQMIYGGGIFDPEYDYQRGLPDYLRTAPGRLSPDGTATTNFFDPTTGLVSVDPVNTKGRAPCLACQNVPPTPSTKDPAAPVVVIGGSSGGSGQVIQTVTGATSTTTATGTTAQASTTATGDNQPTQAQGLNLFGFNVDQKTLPWIVGGVLLVAVVVSGGGKK